MNPLYKNEACIENFEEACIAFNNGAHQIELCSRLDLDGCTPHHHDIINCLERLNMRVKVMIRPTAGSFVISTADIEAMKKEMITMKDLEVQEVVFGMTTVERRLDLDQIAALRDHAYPMEVTIHKAIDTSSDILADTDQLIKMGGIKSILSSGGRPTALEGLSTLREMIKLASDDIQIIPAGKITWENVNNIHELLQNNIYHGRRIVPLD